MQTTRGMCKNLTWAMQHVEAMVERSDLPNDGSNIQTVIDTSDKSLCDEEEPSDDNNRVQARLNSLL